MQMRVIDSMEALDLISRLSEAANEPLSDGGVYRGILDGSPVTIIYRVAGSSQVAAS